MKIKNIIAIILGLISGILLASTISVEMVEGADNITSEFHTKVSTTLEARSVVGSPEYLPYVHEHIDVVEEISRQARSHGVSLEAALRIAKCESTFDQSAKNTNSTAKGVYQFLDGTWEYIQADGHQFDAKENIKQFMINYPKNPQWWECK